MLQRNALTSPFVKIIFSISNLPPEFTVNKTVPVLDLITPSHPPSIAGFSPFAPSTPVILRTFPEPTEIVDVIEQFSDFEYVPLDPILQRSYLSTNLRRTTRATLFSHSGNLIEKASSNAAVSFEAKIRPGRSAPQRTLGALWKGFYKIIRGSIK